MVSYLCAEGGGREEFDVMLMLLGSMTLSVRVLLDHCRYPPAFRYQTLILRLRMLSDNLPLKVHLAPGKAR